MKNTSFEITYVATEAIGMKLPVIDLEELLNASLTLADYGEELQKVFIVFLAVSKEDEFHQEKITYTESEAHLEMVLRLPYKDVLKSDSGASMQLLKEAFLKGIESCKQDGIAEVDWELFHQQAKQFF